MQYRNIIDSRGLKHRFVADYIGVSKSMLSLFLKGERNLAPERLMKLHKLLNIGKQK
ncbi:helix-turn-helix domain-containing protein [Metabacillus sp. Hm71]|uniref:helix-turn-helix domain-containing protein n=1 Tax=Metabacillus sp. Hm71 TaxID=3450743 RepID=UPI003F435937